MAKASELAVIITTHDISPYLADCVSSVLAAAGPEALILIVDDASTDSTVDIALGAQKQNANIDVISCGKNSRSAGRPRNVGLANLGHRKFVSFVDGDDLLLREGFRELLEMMDDSIDFGIANREIFHEETGRIQRRMPVTDFGPAQIGQQWLAQLRSVAVHGRIYSTRFLAQNHLIFPEFMVWEDVVFSQRTYAHANQIRGTSAHSYRWRVRSHAVGDPSVMQSRLRAFSIDSSVRQMRLSAEIGASPSWAERFPALTAASELRDRFFSRHVTAFANALAAAQRPRLHLDPDADIRRWFEEPMLALQRAGNDFRSEIKTLPARQQRYWSAILAGDINKIIDLALENHLS